MLNELGGETSPYLLQHQDNPVHWRPWGPAALKCALTEKKPILLSVGYAACHWCHVMAHESFEDRETAQLMNDLFVCIKVDREERPDIDAIYQQALALMGEHGGWPLTMFLTPETEPFWGGTYFPPTALYGRPAFRDLLVQLHGVWQNQPETVIRNTRAIGNGLARLSHPAEGPAPDALAADGLTIGLMDTAAQQLVRIVDTIHGGIGGAPKFPQTNLFDFLWRAARRGGDEELHNAVTLTLDAMCQGGIYDHLGGGFSRYSTDEVWLAPHFEKMLYDNALLIELLTAVWRATRTPLYEARIRETIDWMLREMRAPGGAFAAAYDADSEGEEGRFYVWRADEIDGLLGGDADCFKRHYDVKATGNWEGNNILNRSKAPGPTSNSEEECLARGRKILFEKRLGRVAPGRDDKVLADWNGLAITALAEAGSTFHEDAWLTAAVEAYDFVALEMVNGEDGGLNHAACAGKMTGQGFLDDYANMARAALSLFEATGSARYLADAETWAGVVLADFRDHEHGGFFFTSRHGESLITRTRSSIDNATPSGNGVFVGVLAKLFHLTGKAVYSDEARGVINAFAGELARNFISVATLMTSAEALEAAVQVVIIGEADADDTQALAAAVYQAPEPNRLLSRIAPAANLPTGHPAAGKDRIGGRATAYVCRGPVCSLPVTEPSALAEALGAPVAS